MTFVPFSIPSLSEKQSKELMDRLEDVHYPQELEPNVGWSYGAPRWAVKPLVETWRNAFNWEKSREEMNRWKHYRGEVEDINLHFVHEPSSDDNAIPIMLLHGWPSTFYEFHKLIEPLRDGVNGGQKYHVVVPSLPGYGFSAPPTTTGYDCAKMGIILNALMVKLGYTKYMLFGTDWGALIGKWIAIKKSENCKAFLTTMPVCVPPLPTIKNVLYNPLKVAKFVSSIPLGFDSVYGKDVVRIIGRSFMDVENNPDAGYRGIQGTRPYTLAYSLTDSPVGLLAWILEKYHAWTYHPGDAETTVLPDTISSDEFLTQLTIYWMTRSIGPSTRLYYEVFHAKDLEGLWSEGVTIPMGYSIFEAEIMKMPAEWVNLTSNLTFLSEHKLGGHFAALEESDLLLDDIQRFTKNVGLQAFS
ncbi:Alpha/Beta hydrolase protein [Phycomyces nitens]|nr:Alpha/Beta hydrolase protein [Phycomyces nitens]